MPRPNIATLLLLLGSFVLYSPQVDAGLVARGPAPPDPRPAGVCKNCPVFPGVTSSVTLSPTTGNFNCAYSDGSQCVFFINDGFLDPRDPASAQNPNCPIFCCDDGYTFTGAAGCKAIAICSAGQYRDVTINQCKDCSPGTYLVNGACQACSAGTFSGKAATTCTPCSQDTISDAGASSCTACPSHATAEPGSSSCTFHCPAGQFVKDNACALCATGTYSTGGAPPFCGYCGSNTYAPAGSDQCFLCPPGMTSDPGAASCTLHCEAGKFISGDSCNDCPAGYYSGADATACSPCPSNTISEAGSSSCTLHCPAGQFIENGSCRTCAAGTYSIGGDATACTSCEENTSSTAGAGSCTACPNGQTAVPGSADGCLATCKPGEVRNSVTKDCIPCQIGTYAVDGVCLACLDGSVSGVGAASCTPCSENTFAQLGAGSCAPCPGDSKSEPVPAPDSPLGYFD
ncbi:hypothetical protein DFH06DRAFT_264846 [Mycena polygramma]|nr:hypothetical protein DFH06DRAFT_264846 [Mycena polygramma]